MEVYVLDRGSVPSAEPLVKEYGPAFHYAASSQDIHIAEGANAVIKELTGRYFIHLADDDVLCRSALAEAKKAFEKYPDCKVCCAGLIGYDAYLNPGHIDFKHFSRHWLHSFSDTSVPEYETMDGGVLCRREWALSNVRCKPFEPAAPLNRLHPSCLFFDLSYLKESTRAQGGAFIKPMWDVGTHAALYRARAVLINKPLAIVSENSPGRQSNAAYYRWKEEKYQYLPLKIGTLGSCFTETILKVIHLNRLIPADKIVIDPRLYWVMYDSVAPFAGQVKEASEELKQIKRFILKSCFLHPIRSFSVYVGRIKWLRRLKTRKERKAGKNAFAAAAQIYFQSITQYRRFVEERFGEKDEH